MKSFWYFLDRLQDYMKMGASVCVVGMAAITCCDIVLRKTINSPIFGSEELVSICAILAMSLTLPYSHKKDVHIGVEIAVRLLSQKTQSIIKMVTNSLSFVMMVIISWRIVLFASSIAKSGQRSMNLQLPMYYFSYFLGLCFFIFALCILKDIVMFFTGNGEEI